MVLNRSHFANFWRRYAGEHMSNWLTDSSESYNCLPKNKRRMLKLYIAILEKNWLFGVTMFVAIFSTFWTVLESIGTQGSLWLFISLIGTSFVVVFGLQILQMARWNIINWAINVSLPTILKYRPAVIIGVGRGGSHIAAMLCHKLSQDELLPDNEDLPEPYFISIDRNYFLEGRILKTKFLNLSYLDFDNIRSKGNVLLTTAEVRTGATLQAASELLNKNGIMHKTFTVTTSPDPIFKVHYFLVKTKSRSLIPWGIHRLKQQIN